MLDGHPSPIRYLHSTDNRYRLDGGWIGKRKLKEVDADLLSSLKLINSSLPGWPLVEGIDKNAFTPDPHQFLASDMFATDWLGFTGIPSPSLTRTRIILADEGGTGKTLTAAIASRWVSVKKPESGPIIVLCPPLLTEEWMTHLRAVFNDDPERVQSLGSARYFDPKTHKNSILVVSKFSWAYRWEEIRTRVRRCPPSCVIIDEIHQGRTRYSDELKDEYQDEDGSGHIHKRNQKDEHDVNSSLATSQRVTCSMAGHVIGVSATPINLDDSELDSILEIIWAEQAGGRPGEQLPKHLPAGQAAQSDTRQGWMTALAKLSKSAREAVPGEKVNGAPLGEMASLVDSLHSNDFLQVLNPSLLAILSDWLSSSSRREFDPSFILRICRELHPYGRHLSMTLRSDLSLEESEPGSPSSEIGRRGWSRSTWRPAGPSSKNSSMGWRKMGKRWGPAATWVWHPA